MKGFLAGFLCAGILFVGWFVLSPSPQAPCPPSSQESTKVEYRERDCPVVAEPKGQEIEEAFLLFLAAIGIKNQKIYQDEIKTLVANPQGYQASAELPPIEEDDRELEEKTTVAASDGPQVFYNEQESLKLFQSSGVMQEVEEQYPQLKRHSAFLLKEPALHLARSKLVESFRPFVRMNGSYTGKLYRMSGQHKGKIEDVELTIDYYRKGKNQIDGSFRMVLSRDGKIFSDSKGSGGNNDILTHPENPKQIIIRASPHIFFHFSDSGLRTANAYERDEFIGVVRLFKN